MQLHPRCTVAKSPRLFLQLSVPLNSFCLCSSNTLRRFVLFSRKKNTNKGEAFSPNKKLHLKSSRECVLRRVTRSLFRVEQHCKFMSACSFHWYSDNACQMQLSLHLQSSLSCLLVSTGSAKFNSCFKMGIKLGCSCFSHQNTRAQSWGRVHGFITPLSDTAAIRS